MSFKYFCLFKFSPCQQFSFMSGCIHSILGITQDNQLQGTGRFEHITKTCQFLVEKCFDIFLIFAHNIDRGYTLEPTTYVLELQ